MARKAANVFKPAAGLDAVFERSPTGIVELDEVLARGFPKGAVILLSGNSGTGKTLLSQEWLFNGVNKFKENGVYVTFTEPLFKTLKNLEGMKFYSRPVIENEKIRILDIRNELWRKGLNEQEVLKLIEAEVKKNGARRLVIDSITAIAYYLQDKAKIRKFIFDLGTVLSSLGCTTILTSEVAAKDKYSVYDVEEFISDGIILLKQEQQKFQKIRTLEIAKMRGTQFAPEPNEFRITAQGIKLFPRLKVPLTHASGRQKISFGVKGLDEMAHGGVYEGSTNLVAGSTGCGKSVLGLHFIWEGLKKKEPCLLVGFEESRDQILRNALKFGWDLRAFEKNGLLEIMCAYPSAKTLGEHLNNIKNAVNQLKVKRCVVDSLSSIGNTFDPAQLRHFTEELNAFLKSKKTTSLFTTATAGLTVAEKLTASNLSTATDNIFLLKYVEAGGKMKLMAAVLKTRGDDHSKSLREYEITNEGIVIGQPFKGYESVMTGSARKVSETLEEQLKEVFAEFLGPMASIEFNDLKEKGRLNEEGVLAFVEGLVEEGILKQLNGKAMKEKVKVIYEMALT